MPTLALLDGHSLAQVICESVVHRDVVIGARTSGDRAVVGRPPENVLELL